MIQGIAQVMFQINKYSLITLPVIFSFIYNFTVNNYCSIICSQYDFFFFSMHAFFQPDQHITETLVNKSLVDTDLEVKVEQNDHLSVTRLEEGILDVVVQNVHLVSTDGGEAETWSNQTKSQSI